MKVYILQSHFMGDSSIERPDRIWAVTTSAESAMQAGDDLEKEIDAEWDLSWFGPYSDGSWRAEVWDSSRRRIVAFYLVIVREVTDRLSISESEDT